jgi:hypothetical protein
MAVRNQTSGSTTGRIDNLRRAGRVPEKNILRSNSPADVAEQDPIDRESFETEGNDHDASSPMGEQRTNFKPAGTRPMNVTATAKPPRAPGLAQTQRAVTARPAAKGLTQNMSANVRPPRASGLNQSLNPVRKTAKVTTVPAQKNRNVRPGSANPAFYGDF